MLNSSEFNLMHTIEQQSGAFKIAGIAAHDISRAINNVTDMEDVAEIKEKLADIFRRTCDLEYFLKSQVRK